MGLHIHSLGELPDIELRGYYIYLLNYGWHESLGKVLEKNFERMANLASKNDAIVMQGGLNSHFNDDVLAWHGINGDENPELLPAIVITTKNPHFFKNEMQVKKSDWNKADHLVVIPLKKFCTTTTEVVELIDKIFRDISEKKILVDFSIHKRMNRGKGRAVVDALILEPNFAGMGIDLRKLKSILTSD